MSSTEKERKGQNYLHGAAILTLGVIIMKILGFLYKMPIANVIGPDGYSMFMQTYNVYNVFLTLSTAGLPIALARMVSEANAENRPIQARETFTVAWWTFFWLGLGFSLIMFLLPDWLARAILHNPPAAASIRAMAPSVLLVCLVSAYRGYIQGFGNMIPTTVGQVLEVVVKVIVGLALAMLVMRAGLGKHMGSAAAIFGVTAGSGAALLYMWLYKRRHYPRRDPENPDRPDSRRAILLRFLRIGVPIAFGSSVLAFLNLIDSSLTMGRLQSAAGYPLKEASTLLGVYGEAQNIFNLPAAIVTPLTISIVPAISAAIAKGEDDQATKISEDSLRIASVLAMPMAVGLVVLSQPIMHVIYRDAHPAGPQLLAIMGAASFFVCLVLVETAILQASGRELLPMIAMIVGGVVKVVLNYFLVADPRINIYGAPMGTLVSYVVMFIMNFVFLCFVLDKNPKLRVILTKPLLCSAIMGALAYGLYRLTTVLLPGGGRMHMLLCMGVSILAAVVVYLVLTIITRMITREDMRLVPGGEKLSRLLRLR